MLGLVAVMLVGVGYAQTRSYQPLEPIGTANIPPTKLAFLEMVDATEAAALTAVPTAPRDPNYRPHPTPAPRPTAPTGIQEGYEPPFPEELYTIINDWTGRVANEDVEVYAGLSHLASPPRGVVVVEVYPNSGSTGPAMTDYLTPGQSGPLRIVSYKGTELTIQDTGRAAGAKPFIFDVGRRAWVALP